MSSSTVYDKVNPYYARLKKRVCLSQNSSKKTYHIEIDLQDSGITYEAGDSIAIIPENPDLLVKQTLSYFINAIKSSVFDKHQKEHTFEDYLKKHINLRDVTKKLLNELALRQLHPQKKDFLYEILKTENRELYLQYIEGKEAWDVLEEHSEVQLTPQEFIACCLPLLPRFYSISSSQSFVGNEVHLTVVEVAYTAHDKERKGSCTHYLCQTLQEGDYFPLYLQKSHSFRLPIDDDLPIIMIGPGTGVAPFRAFMQERLYRKASAPSWLFFGEWNKQHHFFYEDFWKSLVDQNLLKLDTAFSRDQSHKIYVQDIMKQNQVDLYQWLQNGAYLYVCGDAKRMAKDVEQTLLEIIINQGNSEEEARNYIKQLRKEKRYQRDIY